ncbi:MAG: hypothetical protein ACRCTP_15925 [Aeromonas popoffii]|uniref:hypothetical protein n=1 Tax=Aeromonas popoffii TaxID=70856 RepID=UPI003F2ECD66
MHKEAPKATDLENAGLSPTSSRMLSEYSTTKTHSRAFSAKEVRFWLNETGYTGGGNTFTAGNHNLIVGLLV